MEHLPNLVKDLALILLVASIVTIIFKKLKQPVVLGYLLAGFLISPHFVLLPSVVDSGNIATWAEIGVIFLLFALGLEFSFKRLFSLGSPVFIGSVVNFCTMVPVGYLVGHYFMGWTPMASAFLGCMLSMSSTTIIIKAFDEMGLKKRRFATLVFGILIVEDLVAILMMVLLSTIAISRGFEGMELIEQILKLVFFIAMWLIVGIYIFPTLLERIRKVLTDETLLLLSVGLCFGMVLFANAVGFSTVLGAFIMGSILSETVQLKRIEYLLAPLKNLFGAVFFVSVGMMIEPAAITEYWAIILKITAIVIVGRVLFATLGMVLAGENLKTALHAGHSLAQIGEFSFILASLGMHLNVIDPFIYPIIVTVSVITSFLTPYMIKSATPMYERVEKIIPSKWNKLITGYSSSREKQVVEESAWKKYLKSSLYSIAVYSLLSVTVILAAKLFLLKLITNNIDGIWGLVLYTSIIIIAMSPFINAIINSDGRIKDNVKEKRSDFNTSHQFGIMGLVLLKHILPFMMTLVVLLPILQNQPIIWVTVALAITIIIKFITVFKDKIKKMEERFRYNLSDKSVYGKALPKEIRELLRRRSIHIERVEIPANYANIGKTLGELNFRNAVGVSIVSIIRGGKIINIPSGHTRLYPFDKLVVAGPAEEIQKFIKIFEKYSTVEHSNVDVHNYRVELSQYELVAGNPWIGRTIRDIEFQKKTNCLITSIERKGKMIVKFSADFELKQNDILWLAGEKQKILDFESALLK